MSLQRTTLLALAALTALLLPFAGSAAPPAAPPGTPTLLVSGLAGGSGSTVGPDGALYVPEPAAGRIARVDPDTGAKTTYASGLPASIIGLGGAMDVAFIGRHAYALVTLVSPDVGGNDVDGIYRIDGPNNFTVVADIGAFSLIHPPTTDYFVPTGLQYALEPYGKGSSSPTGTTTASYRSPRRHGDELYHLPQHRPHRTGAPRRHGLHGRSRPGPPPARERQDRLLPRRRSPSPTEIASGGRLLVDVEFGRGNTLFALSQGVFPDGNPPGSPALPDTGLLLRVNTKNGTLTTVADELNQPTSLDIVQNTAYVVTLNGEIWKIDRVAGPPYGF